MEARRLCSGSYDIHPDKRWRRLGPEWQPRVDWSSGIFLKVELMLLGKICVVGSLWLSPGPPRECTLLPLPWSEASGTSLRSTGWPLVRAFSPPSFCLSASLTSLYPIQCLLTGSSPSGLCQSRSSPFSKAQLHPCPQPCVLTSSPLGLQTLTRLSFRADSPLGDRHPSNTSAASDPWKQGNCHQMIHQPVGWLVGIWRIIQMKILCFLLIIQVHFALYSVYISLF